MNIRLLAIISLLCLSSCSSERQTDDSVMDLNSDGTTDVFYEYDSSGYYELVDRNFDGRVDESHRYDAQNKITSSKIDEDFDGYLETKISYKFESIERIAVDTDGDKLYEIFHFYKSGSLENSIRFYQENSDTKIGKISFKFGYPNGGEVIEVVTIDKAEFQKIGENKN